jgi:DNA-binding transcriptional regulator YiaG
MHCVSVAENVREVPYPNCGLSNVYLLQRIDEPNIGVNLPTLILAVVEQLIEKPTLLVGQEISFLRKAMLMKATDLARTIGVEPETLSRWENNKARIGIDKDRLLRCLAFNHLAVNYPTFAGRFANTDTVPATSSFINVLGAIQSEGQESTTFKIVIDLEKVRPPSYSRGPLSIVKPNRQRA